MIAERKTDETQATDRGNPLSPEASEGQALGFGAGLANAEPPPGPLPGWVQPGPPDFRPEDRGAYDQAVRDHRPFQYDGQWVNPVFDQGHRGWGFWLGPIWIRSL